MASPTTVPAEEIQVIEPPKGWIGVDWAELWRFRELFAFIVWRDIKVKYKQTFLGVMWAVLVPFLQMLVFTAIATMGNIQSDGLPKVVFYFTNMVLWNYFATSMTMSGQSLVTNAKLLTKIYCPRLIMPAGPVLAGLVDFGIACCLLMGVMLFYGIVPSWTIIFAPLALLLAFFTSLGVGFFLSAVNVKYRDVRYAVPPLVQIWMFSTVTISFSGIYERLYEKYGDWCYLWGLNPMSGALETFRWCLLREHLAESAVKPWPLLAFSIPVTVILVVFGLFYFRRMERMFADIV